MKTTKIIYWVSTVVLAGMMLMSAVMSIMNGPDAVKFMQHLQYPPYFNPYLGVWKILGVIALFVPGYPRVREWAYAGFTFDLLSAIYSFNKVGDPVSSWILVAVFVVILAVSYLTWHKIIDGPRRVDAAV